MIIYIDPKYKEFMVILDGKVVVKSSQNWYSIKIVKNIRKRNKNLTDWVLSTDERKEGKIRAKLENWYSSGQMVFYIPDQDFKVQENQNKLLQFMSRYLDSTKYPAGYYKNKKGGRKVVHLRYDKPDLATVSWVDTEDYYNHKAVYSVSLQGYNMSLKGQEIIIMGINQGTIVPVETKTKIT